jgi:putative transposase
MSGIAGSRISRNEGTLWQRRFWEHQICDAEDLRRHVDYIYWNPVKHGLVARVADWPHSTFHRDVRLGLYPRDWGGDGVAVDSAGFGEPG